MGLLEGKRILVTGVLTDDSLAFGIAKKIQDEGGEIVLTGAGRGLSLTKRVARRLPVEPQVLELDVTMPDHGAAVADALRSSWGQMDGLVHSIGFAPEPCLGGDLFRAGWDDVAAAIQVSTYSLKFLAEHFADLLEAAPQGGSIVALDFDATTAWPGYNWMGVAKAGLESLARYLARDLGPRRIRVNLICAGPVRTMAARSIPDFSRFEDVWDGRAPLGWDVRDSEAVSRAAAVLLSDWLPMTTGEMIHVDGGFHAMGA